MGVRAIPLLMLGFVACGEPADPGPYSVPVENPTFLNNLPALDRVEFSVEEDTPLVDRLTATDPEGDPVSFTVASAPVDGELELRLDGRFTYTPGRNFFGREFFSVVANDGFASTEEIEVSVRVELLRDDPPSIFNDIFVLSPGEPAEGTLVTRDPDLDVLEFSVVGEPTAGEVVLDQITGEYTYTPNTIDEFVDEFEVMVDDGVFTDTATIRITYAVLQNVPIVLPLLLTTPEDTPASDTVVVVPAAAATTFFLGTQPSHGIVALDNNTGDLTYTPDRDYVGPDNFTVLARQGAGQASPPGFVTVDVTPVNDVPSLLSVGLLTTTEDKPVNGQFSAFDVEGDPLTFVQVAAPAHGSVALDATTGAFVYIPDPDYSGADSFEVIANDGQDDSARQSVTVVVTPVNDAPTFSGPLSFSTPRNTPLDGQIVATDAEGSPIFYLVESLPTFGGVTLNSSTGEFTYVPESDYAGPDQFTVIATDGQDSSNTFVALEVTP